MASFTASFHFEADTLEAAEELVKSWTVTAGTTLVMLAGQVSSTMAPTLMSKDGPVSDGETTVPSIEEPTAQPTNGAGEEATT